MKMETVSGKITAEQREMMRKLGIKPSTLIKSAVDKEIRKKNIELLLKKAQKLSKTFDKLSVERAVQSIREDRDSR